MENDDEASPNSCSDSTSNYNDEYGCKHSDEVAIMSSSDDDNDLVKIRHRTSGNKCNRSPNRSKFDKGFAATDEPSSPVRNPDDDLALIERMYGDDNKNTSVEPSSSPFRRLSRRLSRQLVRRTSSVSEALPDTISGLTVLLSSLAATAVSYELYLQKILTRPPDIYGQIQSSSSPSPIAQVYQIIQKQHQNTGGSCFQ